MTLRTFAFCLLPFVLANVSHAQTRDAIVRQSGTAVLSGVLVTEDQPPQPIARAKVELSRDGDAPRTTYTDTKGIFAFNGLPAGRYSLAATMPAYVRAEFGAKRPGRPGTPITLGDGQRITSVQ